MARGGKQPGAGRPKGSKTRPQLRDYYDKDEIEELVTFLKEKAKEDVGMAKFVAEQIFGKAIQPIGGDKDSPLIIDISEAIAKKRKVDDTARSTK